MMDGVKGGSVTSLRYQDVQFSGVSKDQLIQVTVSLVNLGQGENLADPKQQVSILIEKLFKWLRDHQGPPTPRTPTECSEYSHN